MYEEIIERLNPKPKFNLTWYRDKDLYSEGEIEDTIIHLISENDPEDYVQAIADNYSWSAYYHLSHIRKNILNWYPFDPEASVLEIGCGMGAITGMLCDRCKEVTAVELSKRRATGALLRCREKDNLEIIVGNLNEISFEKKFDYITLIGVLEYQGSYTATENPYLDFLKKVKSLLKPEGKLLIAIENQYGLKYWCGAREDHTGIPFEGMNQYSISQKQVRTFSKASLEELVRAGGFQNVYFYYPMPDYKLPTVVYSQDCLPSNGNLLNTQYYYVPDAATLVAQEEKIYGDLIRNGVFEFFANSFLVECTEEGRVGEITFASLSCKRFPEYQIGTRFRGKTAVEKFPLFHPLGEGHVQEILENERALQERGLCVWKSRLLEQSLETAYLEAPTLEDILLEASRRKDVEKICEIWDLIYKEILQSSEEVSWEENLMYTLALGVERDREKYGPILRMGYPDMILRNAFWKDGRIWWFDQEWKLEHIPAKFILYRAILQFYCSYEESSKALPLKEIAYRMGVAMLWKEFGQLDELFNSVIIDPVLIAEINGFKGNSREEALKNIKRLMKQ